MKREIKLSLFGDPAYIVFEQIDNIWRQIAKFPFPYDDWGDARVKALKQAEALLN